MPHDLFGDVAVAPPATGSRRSSVAAISIAAHAAAIAAIAAAQLLGVDGLPVPHETLAFTDVRPVRLVDIPLPAPQRRAAGRAVPARSVSPGAAPLDAPKTITPETGLENAPAGPETTIVSGIEGAPAGAVAGVGLPAEPPPPPPPVAPVRLHAGIRAPRRVRFVAPLYPDLARAARVEGIVVIEALRQWRFSPALLNGAPVPVIMTVTVNFSLSR